MALLTSVCALVGDGWKEWGVHVRYKKYEKLKRDQFPCFRQNKNKTKLRLRKHYKENTYQERKNRN